MKLGDVKIIPYKRVYIVAEIGVNHNGSATLAKKSVAAAKKAGADAVKFQLFNPDTLVTKETKKSQYQEKNFPEKMSQYEMLSEFNLTLDEHLEVREFCRSLDIDYSTTPYDASDFDLLDKLKPDWVKIASMHLVEHDFVKSVMRLGYHVVISTGMSSGSDIEALRGELNDDELNRIVILQCTSEYPCPQKDLNLRVIGELLKSWQYVGLSDHSDSETAPAYAVLLGATVIEKHFTLDRKARGPDHAASLEPDAFKNMCYLIAQASEMAGVPEKMLLEVEKKNITPMRRSLIASRDIGVNEELQLNVNCVKLRPFLGGVVSLPDRQVMRTRHFLPKGKVIQKEDVFVS